MPVLPVMATLAQPARNTLKPTDVSCRLTYPCTYRAVPETLVYWADVRPTRCWFGGGRQSRGGGLSFTNGWVLCLGSQYGVRVCRHNPRPTPINRTHSTVSGGRPTLDCGVIKQGRRAGHHPRGWVKWSDQRAGTKPAAVIIVAPAASWADFTPQSIGVGVRPVGLPTRGVAPLTRTFERSVMAW